VPAAEAEPDGEDDACASCAEVLDRRTNVGLDSGLCGLRKVLRVVEVVAAFCSSGRAAEVVERDRRKPALGKSKRELLVEAIEPANVREDHDADPGRLVRPGGEGRDAVPVTGLEDESVV